jgi:hypothetical protein
VGSGGVARGRRGASHILFLTYMIDEMFNRETDFRSMFLIFLRSKLDYSCCTNFKDLFILSYLCSDADNQTRVVSSLNTQYYK